jgi:UDP-N-acetylmuramate: L-alanyl-gamma-D-glutamyl-meso-diaminopimelate ligase
VFQDDFTRAFADATETILAPVFRSTLPDAERLSVAELVSTLRHRGQSAEAAASIDAIVTRLVNEHRPGDLVVLMSNGGFGGIHGRLLEALASGGETRSADTDT